MSKLTEIIPPQSFEIIRDRIGEILKDEIDNQIVLGAPAEIASTIFVERTHPVDHSETPLINVLFSDSDYDNDTANDTDGENIYHIDVYAGAKGMVGESGDKRGMLRLERILGVIRSILKNPEYQDGTRNVYG